MKRRGVFAVLGIALAATLNLYPFAGAAPKEETVTLSITGMT